MSIAQILAHFGDGAQSTKVKNRDQRKQQVETAVHRLNTCVAKTHEIAAELRESYREAAESSKRVIECLTCPERVVGSRRSKDEYEDLP